MLPRLISFFLLFACVSLQATPYRIIVISEGEESPTSSLTSLGQKRADFFVGFLLGIPPRTPPLFADMVSTNSSQMPQHPITFVGAPSSLPAIQTIAPLANVIFFEKAPVTVFTNMPESVQQFIPQKIQNLKRTLYEGKAYNEKTAVICWKEKDIPRLLLELEPRLRNNGSFQKTFPSDHPHSQVFIITYKQGKPSFQVVEIH